MIVQCEECNTNFNLDEKRLRGDSAKVRCSKCRHVFMIFKDQEESLTATMGSIFDESAPVTPATSSFEETSIYDGGFDSEPTVGQPAADEPFASTFDSISLTPESEPTKAINDEANLSEDFSFGDMSFSDDIPAEPAQPAVTPPKPAFDENMLSFADVALGDEDLTTPLTKESYDFDFSDNETAKPPTPVESKPSFDFDFSSSGESAHQPAPAESFDLGGIDFGMTTPTTPAAAASDQTSAAPFTFQDDEPSAPTFIPVPSAEETTSENVWTTYRPFAIAGICATAVICVLTAGYFYVKGAPGNLERMGIQNFGSAAEADKGNFTITAPKAMFIKNKVNGELFVVSGNATSSYIGSRTGVEVQVTLFGKNGEELATNTAYCGSTIDEEQLATLPLAKIEAELTKEPSDDPLESTPVESGKSTNCIVVFKDVPKNATEYGIEIIASHGENLEKLDDF